MSRTPRKTFHLPRSLYDSLAVGESFEMQFSNDMRKEYTNARNRTYFFNMTIKPKKFRLSVKEKKGWAVVTREA